MELNSNRESQQERFYESLVDPSAHTPVKIDSIYEIEKLRREVQDLHYRSLVHSDELVKIKNLYQQCVEDLGFFRNLINPE